MNKFNITTVIREILSQDTNIRAMVGNSIFPLVAPIDTVGDLIIYQRDGYKQEYSQMGVTRQIPTVFINAVSDDYDRSQELASLIYEALEGDFSNPTMKIRLEDSTEEYADKKYIQVLQFSIE